MKSELSALSFDTKNALLPASTRHLVPKLRHKYAGGLGGCPPTIRVLLSQRLTRLAIHLGASPKPPACSLKCDLGTSDAP